MSYTDEDWGPDYEETRPDCVCDNPDPVPDEPWVPLECGNCGRRM